MSISDLWAAVVLQAADDIDKEHYDSADYTQAVAFFTHAGPWGGSRRFIADMVGVHAEELEELGETAIARRHIRDGEPPKRLSPPPRSGISRSADDVAPSRPDSPPDPSPEAPKPPSVARTRRYRRTPIRHRADWIARFLAKQPP